MCCGCGGGDYLWGVVRSQAGLQQPRQLPAALLRPLAERAPRAHGQLPGLCRRHPRGTPNTAIITLVDGAPHEWRTAMLPHLSLLPRSEDTTLLHSSCGWLPQAAGTTSLHHAHHPHCMQHFCSQPMRVLNSHGALPPLIAALGLSNFGLCVPSLCLAVLPWHPAGVPARHPLCWTGGNQHRLCSADHGLPRHAGTWLGVPREIHWSRTSGKNSDAGSECRQEAVIVLQRQHQ